MSLTALRGPDHRDPVNPGMSSRPPKPFRRNGHWCPKCAFDFSRMHTFIESMHSMSTDAYFASWISHFIISCTPWRSPSNLVPISPKYFPNLVPISFQSRAELAQGPLAYGPRPGAPRATVPCGAPGPGPWAGLDRSGYIMIVIDHDIS